MKYNINNFFDIITLTPDICLEVVKLGISLKHIPEQTFEICSASINRNYDEFKYVKEQSPEVCRAAIKRGLTLKYISNQTSEICLIAVIKNGLQLEFVKEQTPEICLEAIKHISLAVKWINIYFPQSYLEIIENAQISSGAKQFIKDYCVTYQKIKVIWINVLNGINELVEISDIEKFISDKIKITYPNKKYDMIIYNSVEDILLNCLNGSDIFRMKKNNKYVIYEKERLSSEVHGLRIDFEFNLIKLARIFHV